MQIHSVGIDLGKTTFHLVALGAAGKVLVRKKFTQKQLLAYTANMQTSLIGLEACSGAHFLGRALRQQGHDVRLIPAQFVKPFVKSNKNDFIDAEAIAEAVERKNMRFVPIKTTISWICRRSIESRPAHCAAYGSDQPAKGVSARTWPGVCQTPAKLKAAMADILENAEYDLTPRMRNLIGGLWSEWKTVEQQIEELNDDWNGSLPRMRAAHAFARYQASAPSWPRPSSLPSATVLHSARAESSQHGSASCHASTRPAVRRSCLASVSEATSTCAGS